MDDMNKVYDLTSDDSKSIGLDFQYFYFIYKLLHLQNGEKIGYESREDVHIETNDSQVLIQSKHTINKKKMVIQLILQIWMKTYGKQFHIGLILF